MKRLLLTVVMAIGMVATRAQYDIIPMPQRITRRTKSRRQRITGTDTVLKTKLFGLKVRHFNNSWLFPF